MSMKRKAQQTPKQKHKARETSHDSADVWGKSNERERSERNTSDRGSVLNSLPRFSGQNRAELSGLRTRQSNVQQRNSRTTTQQPFFDRDNSLDNDEIQEESSYLENSQSQIDERGSVRPTYGALNTALPSSGTGMSQRQTYRQTINQYLPRQSARKTLLPRPSQKPTSGRQTVDEDDDIYNDGKDSDQDPRDEYEDIVRATLSNDDQTTLRFKNILKKDKGFGTLKQRDSVLSGRNSYNSRGRYSSKYGDNKQYLLRLSRNSIDSSSNLQADHQMERLKLRPKPRKYDMLDPDESYFAVTSNGDGDNLETGPSSEKSDFFTTSKREFKIFDKKPWKIYCSNELQSQTYSLFNFVPLTMGRFLAQKQYYYFIAIMLLQMVPTVSLTEGQPTILLGLLPSLLVKVLIEYVEHRKTERQLRQENQRTTLRMEPKDHDFVEDEWANLRVGQVVKVCDNEKFPADLILVKSSNPKGEAYVETLSLDGQSTLKLKESIRDMQDTILSANDASKINGNIYCDHPDDSLYNFDGLMTVKVKNSQTSYKYPLGYKQLLLRGTSLRCTHWVYGVVVYTGKDTKMMESEAALKTESPQPVKESALDSVLESVLFYLGLLLVAMAGLLTYLGQEFNHQEQTKLYFLSPDGTGGLKELPYFFTENFQAITSVILFCQNVLFLADFIPIWMILVLDLARFLQAKFVEWDVSLISMTRAFAAKVKKSGVIDELGQVSYVVADKTGTITSNHLMFRKMSIAGRSYGTSSRDCEDTEEKGVTNFNMVDRDLDKAIKRKLNPQYEQIYKFLYHLALCHNVGTFKDSQDEEAEPVLASTSPDDLASINAAKYYGIKFVEKNQQYNEIIIENEHHQQSQLYKFELLNVIEYTSDRKRTTIIVKAPDGVIKAMCKGADSALLNLLADTRQNAQTKERTLEHLEAYTQEGLRTLMLCEREVTQSFYRSWAHKYEQAKTAINRKQQKMMSVVAEIEKEFTLLGVTAVQDMLQDKAAETISAVKEAGIKFWMVTGDHLETAINIGYSSSILEEDMDIVRLTSTSKDKIKSTLATSVQQAQKNLRHSDDAQLATIVTGETLFKIQQSARLTDSFVELACLSKVLVGCRLSGVQKAEIVQLLRDCQPDKVVLALGDGINDIQMMKEANLAVSVNSHWESNSAERASHFAVAQFKHLKTLLLNHGRESIRKNLYSLLVSMYGCHLIAWPLILYSFYSGFSLQPLFPSTLLQLAYYVTLSLPLAVKAINDIEYKKDILLKNPILYDMNFVSCMFKAKQFFSWGLISFLQAVVLFYLVNGGLARSASVYFQGLNDPNHGQAPDSEVTRNLLMFSMALVVNLRVLQDTHNWSFLTFGAMIVSLGLFGFLLKSRLDQSGTTAEVLAYPLGWAGVGLAVTAMWPFTIIINYLVGVPPMEDVLDDLGEKDELTELPEKKEKKEERDEESLLPNLPKEEVVKEKKPPPGPHRRKGKRQERQ